VVEAQIMADLVLRIGSRSAQGVRANNEDRFVADPAQGLFVVADGMGGQERGELASGMAVDLIPRLLQERLQGGEQPNTALQHAMADTNEAIVEAGSDQPPGRRMGTTAVVAAQHEGTVYVAGLGDSRAYLIRNGQVKQLTLDHSVAQHLVMSGALTPEEARHSPYQHVLHKFLGCANLHELAEVTPFVPQPGDRLVLGSDGLTNHIEEADLREGARQFPDPQAWVDHLVDTALERGSRDNVTCVVVAFEERT